MAAASSSPTSKACAPSLSAEGAKPLPTAAAGSAAATPTAAAIFAATAAAATASSTPAAAASAAVAAAAAPAVAAASAATPPRGSRARASLTLMARPWISRPLSEEIAAEASSSLPISTKANPRGRPVSRSITTFTSTTFRPPSAKASRSSSSVTL